MHGDMVKYGDDVQYGHAVHAAYGIIKGYIVDHARTRIYYKYVN